MVQSLFFLFAVFLWADPYYAVSCRENRSLCVCFANPLVCDIRMESLRDDERLKEDAGGSSEGGPAQIWDGCPPSLLTSGK